MQKLIDTEQAATQWDNNAEARDRSLAEQLVL
jgi:hypothetical protein